MIHEVLCTPEPMVCNLPNLMSLDRFASQTMPETDSFQLVKLVAFRQKLGSVCINGNTNEIERTLRMNDECNMIFSTSGVDRAWCVLLGGLSGNGRALSPGGTRSRPLPTRAIGSRGANRNPENKERSAP